MTEVPIGTSTVPADVPTGNGHHQPQADPGVPATFSPANFPTNGTSTGANGVNAAVFYTEADLARAREQEKSKLYRRLEDMQAQVTEFQTAEQQRKAAEEDQRKQAAQVAKTQAEADMDLRQLLETRQREADARMAELQQQIEAERALRERESQFSQLVDYRSRALDAARDDIAPELIDLVHGETPEEIDASVHDMQARTARILEQMQGAVQSARQQIPGTRVTTPASGTDDPTLHRQFTPDEIRQMSMADYQKNRARLLGQGASGGPHNRGLFG